MCNMAYVVRACIQKIKIYMLHICPEIYLQLLKCLFGTNLSAQWVEPDDNQRTSSSLDCTASSQGSDGFYNVCFQTPYRHLTDFITYSNNKLQDKDEEFMWASSWFISFCGTWPFEHWFFWRNIEDSYHNHACGSRFVVSYLASLQVLLLCVWGFPCAFVSQ